MKGLWNKCSLHGLPSSIVLFYLLFCHIVLKSRAVFFLRFPGSVLPSDFYLEILFLRLCVLVLLNYNFSSSIFSSLVALSWRCCGSSVWGAWLFLRMLTADPLYLVEGPYTHLLVDWAQSLPGSGAFPTLAGHTFQWTLVDNLGILSSDPSHVSSASSCTDSGFTQFWWLLAVHPHLLGISTFTEGTMSIRLVVNFGKF